MEIQTALQAFAAQNQLTYSGCMKYQKSSGETYASVSYSLSEDVYNTKHHQLNLLRSALQKVPITGFTFVDVTAGIIVKKVSDKKPINNMYRIQILYKVISKDLL